MSARRPFWLSHFCACAHISQSVSQNSCQRSASTPPSCAAGHVSALCWSCSSASEKPTGSSKSTTHFHNQRHICAEADATMLRRTHTIFMASPAGSITTSPLLLPMTGSGRAILVSSILSGMKDCSFPQWPRMHTILSIHLAGWCVRGRIVGCRSRAGFTE